MIHELDIKKKSQLGKGTQHTVFPYEKFADKVIKTRWGDLDVAKKHSFLVNHEPMNVEELEIFQRYPNLFVKVYKISKNYAVLEKLDTKNFQSDSHKIALGIFQYIVDMGGIISVPYTIDTNISDSTDIDPTFFIWMAIRKYLDSMLHNISSYCPPYFKQWINFLKELEKIELPKDYRYNTLDVHDRNFGYNKQGEIRMLDL